jgi:predicted LPLAT superfamily acyltransferase
MTWVALTLGRPVARMLLYPICVYFLIGSPDSRRAVARFRAVVCGRPARWWELFRHYYTFAATVLDRVYFLRARFDLFDLRFHGVEVLNRELAKGRGCILVGAHVGSFEVIRAVGVLGCQLDVTVVMDEHNAPLMRRLTEVLSPAVAATVIQAGGVEAMLRARECLERGGIVGMMGDRVVGREQTVECPFFGRPARFPTGALRLASLLGVPAVLCFGLYRGGNRYDIHFESFLNGGDQAGDQHQPFLQHAMRHYVARLEAMCRLAPDNWFNFYEFWDDAS